MTVQGALFVESCPVCGLYEGRHHPTCSTLRPKAHARRTDPETSHEAAGSLTPETLRVNQVAVLWVLRHYGPATDGLIAEMYAKQRLLPLPRQSPSGLRTRRAELVALGRVRDSGRRERLESGRFAVVWEVAW